MHTRLFYLALLLLLQGCATTGQWDSKSIDQLKAERNRVNEEIKERSVLLSFWYADQARAVHRLQSEMGHKFDDVYNKRSPSDILDEQSDFMEDFSADMKSLRKKLSSLDEAIYMKYPAGAGDNAEAEWKELDEETEHAIREIERILITEKDEDKLKELFPHLVLSNEDGKLTIYRYILRDIDKKRRELLNMGYGYGITYTIGISFSFIEGKLALWGHINSKVESPIQEAKPN